MKYQFSKKDLRKFIFGEFDSIDEIPFSNKIEYFLHSIFRKEYPDIFKMSDAQIREECMITDSLITMSSAEKYRIFILSCLKFDKDEKEEFPLERSILPDR